ncbi:MAG: hypothetical protein K9H26_15640 [Prolixibacteraceae bacterium]|nr:hypothetical protein [Prolixibacteraceae bacterium]
MSEVLLIVVLAIFIPSGFTWMKPHIPKLLGVIMFGVEVSLATQFFTAVSALPGAIFSIIHNLTGVSLANWWGKKEGRSKS